MKAITTSSPTMAAVTPFLMESAPSEASTKRFSSCFNEAGRAPVRSSFDSPATSSGEKLPLISPESRMALSITATSRTRSFMTTAILWPTFLLVYS